MKQVVFLIFLAAKLIVSKVYGQHPISITHNAMEKGICLRWYPQSIQDWRYALQAGIHLERRQLVSNVSAQSNESTGFTRLKVIGLDSSVFDADLQLKNPEISVLLQYLQEDSSKETTIASAKKQIQEDRNAIFYSMIILQKNPAWMPAFGLSFTDSSAEKNISYQYRLMIGSDTINYAITVQDRAALLPPEAPEISVERNTVLVQVNSEKCAERYFSYVIERSLDSGRTFESIQEAPVIAGVHVDGAVSKWFRDVSYHCGRLVEYRIHATDYAGQNNYYSDVSSLFLSCEVLEYPENPEFVLMENKGLLQWTYKTELEKFIQGFKIYRADSLEAGMEEWRMDLVPSSLRSIDVESTASSGYFYISAVGFSGEELASNPVFVQFPDQNAPAPATMLQAEVNEEGQLFLKWNRSGDNDVMGYQVFSGNSREGEFSCRSARWFLDTIWRDTLDLNWHRDSIFYFVKAADFSYNESEKSVIYGLAVPVIGAPSAPLVYEALEHHGKVLLKWHPSAQSNVQKYELFRRRNEGEYLLLKTFSKADADSFIDENVTGDNVYFYQLRAVSEKGIVSPLSPEVDVRMTAPKYLPRIEVEVGYIDSLSGMMLLHWQAKDLSYHHFRLIQITGGNGKTIATLAGSQTEFLANWSKADGHSEYCVIGYMQDGRRSIP